jgi:predicted ATP-dependent endonuclease of OLD family
VRGFYEATLPLDNEKILIVGRNHSGKTSAFLLLDWLINFADADRLYRRDYLDQEEQDLLLPARDVQHRARRITLTVHIPDGRITDIRR